MLTIVLPTFNSEKTLRATLISLQKQTYKNFVIFLADGGSSDKTLLILKNSKLFIKIISKKDKTNSEGVNKCLKKIKTKYFCIIGSDDILGDKNYIRNIIKQLEKKPKIDINFPNYGVIINNNKKIISQPKDFSQINYKTIVPGYGWIGKTRILKEGLYSLKLRVATDYEFFLRLYKKQYLFNRNNKHVYYFRIGGHSFKNALTGYKEVKDIALKFNGPIIKIFFDYITNVIKYIIKYKILHHKY